jgi:hypothetical protein
MHHPNRKTDDGATRKCSSLKSFPMNGHVCMLETILNVLGNFYSQYSNFLPSLFLWAVNVLPSLSITGFSTLKFSHGSQSHHSNFFKIITDDFLLETAWHQFRYHCRHRGEINVMSTHEQPSLPWPCCIGKRFSGILIDISFNHIQ